MSSSVLPFLPSRTRAPSAAASPQGLRSAKLPDRLRERIWLMHYSPRTEEAYVYWARAFIRFHGLRHPADIGKQEVRGQLGWICCPHQPGHDGVGKN